MRRIALMLLGLLLSASAMAQDAPLPPARPAELKPAPAPKPPEAAQQANPAEPAPPAAAQSPEPSRPNLAITGDKACQERLGKLGAAFKPRPAIRDGQCTVDSPVDLSGLGPDRPLAPPAILSCAQAEKVARWFAEVVVPAAKTHLQADAVSIGQASAYVCRNRNHAASGKLSEHAFGNALDVASITFAGGRKPVAVEPKAPDSPEEKAFLAEIRRGACAYFTTVLGPGADAAHETHLHLDGRARGNGYRICE